MTYILLQNTSILVQFIIFFNYFLAKSLNPLPKAEWGQLSLCRVLRGAFWEAAPRWQHPLTDATTSLARLCNKVIGGNLSPHPLVGGGDADSVRVQKTLWPSLLALWEAIFSPPQVHTESSPHSLRRSCHFLYSCASFKTHIHTHPTQAVQAQKKPLRHQIIKFRGLLHPFVHPYFKYRSHWRCSMLNNTCFVLFTNNTQQYSFSIRIYQPQRQPGHLSGGGTLHSQDLQETTN